MVVFLSHLWWKESESLCPMIIICNLLAHSLSVYGQLLHSWVIQGDASFYVFLSKCFSGDNIPGNCFIQITSYSRAYVRVIY